MSGLEETIIQVAIIAIPIIIAITFHEAAHGWSAYHLGDDTAYRLGRVSFNPIRHVDPFGTLILPGTLALVQLAAGQSPPFIIGWAKPVPVDFMRLHNPRWGMVLVALAGPVTNLVLAFVSALLLHVVDPESGDLADIIGTALLYSILINVLLMLFNMIPLPPLDGGRVAVGILPAPLARALARTERFGLLIIIGLVFLIPFVGAQFGQDWAIVRHVLLPMVDTVSRFILQAAGL